MSAGIAGAVVGVSRSQPDVRFVERAATIIAQEMKEPRVSILQQVAMWMVFFACCEFLGYLVIRKLLLGGENARSRVEVRGAMMAALHCTIAVPAVVMQWQYLKHPEGPDPNGFFGISILSFVPYYWMDKVGSIFTGYLFWDLSHYLLNRKIYAKTIVEQVVHHILFICMIGLNRNTLWCNYAFAVMYLGELSSFFLNLRLVYRSIGKKEILISAAFAATFTVTRVIVLGMLIHHILSHTAELRELLSPLLQISYLGLLPAVYAMNLWWFYKILTTIAKMFNKSGSNSQQVDGSADGAEGSAPKKAA